MRRRPIRVADAVTMHGIAMLLTHDVITAKMSDGMSGDQVVDVLTRMMLFHPSEQE